MVPNTSRRWAVHLVAVFLTVSMIPSVTAVDVEDDASPEEVKVESVIEDGEAVYTLTDLYTESDRWVLSGTTDLENPRWTIVWYGQDGMRLMRQTISGESFEITVDRNDPDLDVESTRLEIRVSGEVPEIEDYTYDPRPSFTVAAFSESSNGNDPVELSRDTAIHYTEESDTARWAIEKAYAAIDEADLADVNTSEAESDLESAIAAYEAENFADALNLAERAEKKATVNDKQTSATTSRPRTTGAIPGATERSETTTERRTKPEESRPTTSEPAPTTVTTETSDETDGATPGFGGVAVIVALLVLGYRLQGHDDH